MDAINSAIDDTNKKEAFHEEQALKLSKQRAEQARALISQQYATLRAGRHKYRTGDDSSPPAVSLSPNITTQSTLYC